MFVSDWSSYCIICSKAPLATFGGYNGISKQFDLQLTPIWPHMTFDHSIALHFGQGFALPNLEAIGHSWVIWSLVDKVDLDWPRYDHWPQHCTTLRSGVLPTKFSRYRDSLPIWPLIDPGWPLHDLWSQQCITLQSGVVPTKFGGHRTFRKQLDLWMTLNFGASKICSQTSWGRPLLPFQVSAPYLKARRNTYLHCNILSYLHTDLDILIV